MTLHLHFRCSLCSKQIANFINLSSEPTREKIKTKMIGMVESLLNEEDLHTTSSSHETEEAAKQDDFFVEATKRWKTKRS